MYNFEEFGHLESKSFYKLDEKCCHTMPRLTKVVKITESVHE